MNKLLQEFLPHFDYLLDMRGTTVTSPMIQFDTF
jgi:hypothetical protein